MKKILTSILILSILLCSVFGCTNSSGNKKQSEITTEDGRKIMVEDHLIGVVTYNFSDQEVLGFRKYLEEYITGCFPGVEFLYTNEVTSLEEEEAVLQSMKEAGVEGILSFISYDLPAAVEFCSENEMYYMMASGTVSSGDLDAVKNNPYFVGVIGPGNEMETEAGKKMAQHYIEKKAGDSYFILSGGAYFGNEMHRLRTVAALDTLQEAYGVTFAQSSEELAGSQEPITVTAGDLSVCICPGFMNVEEHLTRAVDTFSAQEYDVVMAMMAAGEFVDTCDGSKVECGMIDSFTEDNQSRFIDDKISYLAGKYSSIIGPSFAAMYNALCGYGDDFRVNGEAFSLTQGFWEASSKEEYLEKYALASGVYINAYNYDDLYSVCKLFDPEATLQDLEGLTDAYTFEEASTRRK